MENKFWLKNVEWRYEDYEHLGVRVWHLPTDIQCFLNNKKSYAHALFFYLHDIYEDKELKNIFVIRNIQLGLNHERLEKKQLNSAKKIY